MIIILFLLGISACEKEHILPDRPERIENLPLENRSEELEYFQLIEEMLRDKVLQMLAAGSFTNNNANGLIPQLNNLLRAINEGDLFEANRIVEDDIIPHLEGLHNGKKLTDLEYQVLLEIATGNYFEGTVSVGEILYRWKRMDDGKKWVVENLRHDVAGFDFKDDGWNFLINDENSPYGRLYSLDAAIVACTDLGPGWKLPEESDWEGLVNAYGGWDYGYPDEPVSNTAYSALIDQGYSGFDAQLGGLRKVNTTNGWTSIQYTGLSQFGVYLSTTAADDQHLRIYQFNLLEGEDVRRGMIDLTGDYSYGLSCRCVYE